MAVDLVDSVDDCQQTLAQIARRHGQSIIEMLVQIQNAKTEEWKPQNYLQPLECLQFIDRTIIYTITETNSTGTVKAVHSETVTIPKLLEDIRVRRGLPRKNKKTEVQARQGSRLMSRCHLNVLDGQTNYVAVSYTWDPPNGHDNTSGRYWVENKAGTGFEQSPIRNSLFDRITNYMQALCVDHLWIDQHCIVQATTCTLSRCDHDDCNEKREAVHAMDLVFTSSEHPAAFLSQSIDTWWDLRLLHGLLRQEGFLYFSSGGFDVKQQTPPPSPRLHRFRQVKDTLKLVHRLICDPWWARAWPFQERHVTNSRLRLLSKHPPHLEKRKQALFPESRVPGEIIIQASEFLTQANILCRAMIQHMPNELQLEEKEMIRQVLEAVHHDGPWLGSHPVIPPLVATVISKDIAKPWDRVAILGNCCRYPKRLESQYLQQKGKSLSLSILALVLLNGEVLNNRKNQDQQQVADMTVSQYLASQLCRNGYYASRCGFIDVTITMKGIRTRGHLWKLGQVIDASEGLCNDDKCEPKPYDEWPIDNSEDAIEYRSFWRAARCRKLIAILEASGYHRLAESLQRLFEHSITDCLFRPDRLKKGQIAPTPSLATLEVIDAIGRGKKVRVGRLWHPGLLSEPSCYSSLFVWENEHGIEGQQSTCPATEQRIAGGDPSVLPPAMVFTATRVKDFGSPLDPDNHAPTEEGKFQRHLSLEVKIENPSKKNVVFSQSTGKLPSLKTKRWLSGIHFPEICMRPSRIVVFPWPHELVAIDGRRKGASSGRPSRTRIYDDIASRYYGWDRWDGPWL